MKPDCFKNISIWLLMSVVLVIIYIELIKLIFLAVGGKEVEDSVWSVASELLGLSDKGFLGRLQTYIWSSRLQSDFVERCQDVFHKKRMAGT